MEYALEINNLRKEYKGFLLDDINIKIPRGNIVGLIGENGAGKSTTIKAALDLIHKDGGEALFFGKKMIDSPEEIKEKIGVVFDGINFNETLTPEKINKVCRNIYKNWSEEVYCEYISRLKLPRDKEIKALSKGMQVKLCLAVALSHNASLLILDEPTAGLDPVMRDEILDIFLDFVQNEDHAILISSHITSDLEKIADYITFIHEGQIILNKSKDDILYNYGILRCGRGELASVEKEDILRIRNMDYQCNILVKDRQAAAKKYKNMVVDPATIDEIMLFYVKGE